MWLVSYYQSLAKNKTKQKILKPAPQKRKKGFLEDFYLACLYSTTKKSLQYLLNYYRRDPKD